MATPIKNKDVKVDYSGDEAINMIDKWKKEGIVKKLDESFYTDIISLVEDIYHTKNLLKG